MAKTQFGYVAQLKCANLYMTKNGSALGALGDQSEFFPSDKVQFFVKKPSTSVSRKKFNIRQAEKSGSVISLCNHSPKDTKTLSCVTPKNNSSLHSSD